MQLLLVCTSSCMKDTRRPPAGMRRQGWNSSNLGHQPGCMSPAFTQEGLAFSLPLLGSRSPNAPCFGCQVHVQMPCQEAQLHAAGPVHGSLQSRACHSETPTCEMWSGVHCNFRVTGGRCTALPAYAKLQIEVCPHLVEACRCHRPRQPPGKCWPAGRIAELCRPPSASGSQLRSGTMAARSGASSRTKAHCSPPFPACMTAAVSCLAICDDVRGREHNESRAQQQMAEPVGHFSRSE